MNPMPTTLSRLVCGLAVVVSTGLTTACATSSQPTRKTATTPEVRSSVSTEGETEPPPKSSVDKPTPEELAASPCGNPAWAQLPPDSEIDGDRKDESESSESSETTSETTEDESNDTTDR